ncbi:MAG: reactive intermediate/imine deaminase [Gammaproteobacteria bacterium]|nr:reactive intermediate/imine deaminase [Gammaproteobacteria bacterium]
MIGVTITRFAFRNKINLLLFVCCHKSVLYNKDYIFSLVFMKYKTINSDKFNTPYSDAIEIGDLIEFSGMIGNTEDGLVEGGFEYELGQIFKNLKDGLAYYNLNYSNVIRAKILLSDIDDMPKLNEIYLTYFQKPLPIRTTFAVAGLPYGAKVEIEFSAIK